jgi:hypothetical protein
MAIRRPARPAKRFACVFPKPARVLRYPRVEGGMGAAHIARKSGATLERNQSVSTYVDRRPVRDAAFTSTGISLGRRVWIPCTRFWARGHGRWLAQARRALRVLDSPYKHEFQWTQALLTKRCRPKRAVNMPATPSDDDDDDDDDDHNRNSDVTASHGVSSLSNSVRASREPGAAQCTRERRQPLRAHRRRLSGCMALPGNEVALDRNALCNALQACVWTLSERRTSRKRRLERIPICCAFTNASVHDLAFVLLESGRRHGETRTLAPIHT